MVTICFPHHSTIRIRQTHRCILLGFSLIVEFPWDTLQEHSESIYVKCGNELRSWFGFKHLRGDTVNRDFLHVCSLSF